jgi:O-antigen/teichoic acid export membrane protein
MIKQLAPKSEFRRNVLTLMTGTAIAQAMPIIISPILTRIYTPEDFGIFAIYIGLLSIGSVIATGRYEMSILLPKKDLDAVHIVELSILISLFVSIFFMILIILFDTHIAILIGVEAPIYWLYLTPLSIFVFSIYNTLMYWVNRSKEYKSMSKYRIIQSGSISIFQVAIGVLGKLSFGLSVSDFFGRLISIVIMLKDMPSVFRFWTFSLKKIALARRFVKFPKFEMPASLFNALSYESVYLIMPVLFGVMIAGLYFLVFRVLMAPAAVAGNAILEVFRNRAMDDVRKHGNCRPLFIKMMLLLLVLGVVPSLIIILFGQEIFLFVFGPLWVEAGVYAQILMPMVFLRFVSSPLSYMFFIREELKVDMALQFFYLFMVIISLLLGWYFSDSIVMTIFLSLSGCIFYLVQIVFSYKYSGYVKI